MLGRVSRRVKFTVALKNEANDPIIACTIFPSRHRKIEAHEIRICLLCLIAFSKSALSQAQASLMRDRCVVNNSPIGSAPRGPPVQLRDINR
jgi:hypothetical protein